MAPIQVPFPALTSLELWSADEIALVLPESFLGGCVPGLRSLELGGIQFPAVRKLLLSDISPEAMTTSLSTLTKLETLHLGFLSPQSRPNQTGRRLPPLKRILLPALTSLWFRGISEYLEDLVSQIDAPLLDDVIITFFNPGRQSQGTAVEPAWRRHLQTSAWSAESAVAPWAASPLQATSREDDAVEL
ncbi:hypothetical protein BJV74DRAFT_861637 [Russula compacta]|nr:hypothetical protein BJV74DRAFT_861637 [Russula compacta]